MTNIEKAVYAHEIATTMNCEGCKTFSALHDFCDANGLLPPIPVNHSEDDESYRASKLESHFAICNTIMEMAEAMVNHNAPTPPLPPLLTLQELCDLIHPTWFEIEENNHLGIELATRDNGDVGEETPGKQDLEEAQRIADILHQNLPNVPVTIETIEEWTHVSVNRPQ